jgi:hypothetical protein
VARALLALWCLLWAVSGDARALCLDFGGNCSPSAAVPAGPCHDQVPEGGSSSNCGACVDILVPDDASALGCRAHHELLAPVTTLSVGSAGELLVAKAASVPAPHTAQHGCSPLSAGQCTSPLRI